MLFQIIKKLLLIFPVIFLLAILVFFLSDIAPGDRVEDYLDLSGVTIRADEQLQKQDYIDIAKSLDLDLPSFYFSITPGIYPDTLYKLNLYPNGKLRQSLFKKYFVMGEIDRLFLDIETLLSSIAVLDDSLRRIEPYPALKTDVLTLQNSDSPEEFKENIDELKSLEKSIKTSLPIKISELIERIIRSYSLLESSKPSLSGLLPKISFYGTKNRFHKWFGKVLRLDFGTSIVDGREAFSKILKSLKWTLLYISIAYILTFTIAIPFGIYTAANTKKKFSKMLNLVFIAFHSMPLFWLATMAVLLFTSSEISSALNIFPSIGIGDIDSDMSLLQQLRIAAPHLILPSLIVAIHSGAYLGTLIRRNMLNEMRKKYFLALLSRGIPRGKVIMKHIFPNSILPLITLLVVSLPASLAGSVITEVIFNIPGMGRLLYDSILHYDWNIVFAIVLLIGFATYLAYIFGDILYRYFNPKIRLVQ